MAMPGQAGGLDYVKRRSDKVNITFDIFLQEIEKTKISLKISGKGELGGLATTTTPYEQNCKIGRQSGQNRVQPLKIKDFKKVYKVTESKRTKYSKGTKSKK